MTKRKSINIPEFQHTNPIPNASLIGTLLMTGVILGRDSQNDIVPESLEEQCSLMFKHIHSIILAAGGTPNDILKVTVWLKNISNKKPLNSEWEKMFPDPNSRPARQTLIDNQDWPYLISCEFTAVLSQ